MAFSTDIRERHITATKRKQDVLSLRLAGLNYAEIRDAMLAKYGPEYLPGSWDERYAWRDVQDEMTKLRKENLETAETIRAMEVMKLDQLQSALMPDALRGNLKTVDRVLKIMDHRAKILGLYAPSKHEVKDWRSEIIELIRSGKITREDIIKDYGEEFARYLLEPGSSDAVEGSFIEAEDSTGFDGS